MQPPIIYVLPKNGVLPEVLEPRLITGNTLFEKLRAYDDAHTLMVVDPRELQVLVDNLQTFGIRLRAILAIPGALYSSPWEYQARQLQAVTLATLDEADATEPDRDPAKLPPPANSDMEDVL